MDVTIGGSLEDLLVDLWKHIAHFYANGATTFGHLQSRILVLDPPQLAEPQHIVFLQLLLQQIDPLHRILDFNVVGFARQGSGKEETIKHRMSLDQPIQVHKLLTHSLIARKLVQLSQKYKPPLAVCSQLGQITISINLQTIPFISIKPGRFEADKTKIQRPSVVIQYMSRSESASPRKPYYPQSQPLLPQNDYMPMTLGQKANFAVSIAANDYGIAPYPQQTAKYPLNTNITLQYSSPGMTGQEPVRKQHRPQSPLIQTTSPRLYSSSSSQPSLSPAKFLTSQPQEPKAQSRVSYFPYQRKIMDFEDRKIVERVPVKKKVVKYEERKVIQNVPREVVRTEYYAVEKRVEYHKEIIPERRVEVTSVEKKVKRYEYVPVQKQIVHFPGNVDPETAKGESREVLQQQGLQIRPNAQYRPITPALNSPRNHPQPFPYQNIHNSHPHHQPYPSPSPNSLSRVQSAGLLQSNHPRITITDQNSIIRQEFPVRNSRQDFSIHNGESYIRELSHLKDRQLLSRTIYNQDYGDYEQSKKANMGEYNNNFGRVNLDQMGQLNER